MPGLAFGDFDEEGHLVWSSGYVKQGGQMFKNFMDGRTQQREQSRRRYGNMLEHGWQMDRLNNNDLPCFVCEA